MLDISTQNFEAELINASVEQPVLLDIWAPWCGPCKALGPTLEKLEVAYAGRFKLAKLNSDDQPDIAGQLSQMFGVRSIPFCVMFKGGQPVDGFVGALPEADIRKFLDKHVPSAEEVAWITPRKAPTSPASSLREAETSTLKSSVSSEPSPSPSTIRPITTTGVPQSFRIVWLRQRIRRTPPAISLSRANVGG